MIALMAWPVSAAGPTSNLYVMNYGEFGGGSVVGLNLFQGLSELSFPTGNSIDICIAVAGGDVRTFGYSNGLSGNPRQNDAAVDAVAESIRQFGFRQPIVVDTEGVIIVGHTRYKATLKLGPEKVPVHVAKDLSPEKIRAYRIADNKTADLSPWDYELLPIELSALQGMDFDLERLGFSKDDLAKIFDPGVKAGLPDPDEVPEPLIPTRQTTPRGLQCTNCFGR